MERVQVFLRSPLFTIRSEGHIPSKAVILEGTVLDQQGAGLEMEVTTWRNADGSTLAGEARKLFIPPSKIDHVWILD